MMFNEYDDKHQMNGKIECDSFEIIAVPILGTHKVICAAVTSAFRFPTRFDQLSIFPNLRPTAPSK